METARNLADDFSGPIIFNYVWWVLLEAQKRGIKRLYFLARDGYTLLGAARIFCDRFRLDIECRYLYCSRQALRMPTYFFIGEEAFDLLFHWGYYVSLKSVLARLDLTEEERREIYIECALENVEEDRQLPKWEFDEYVHLLRESRVLRRHISDKSKAAYESAIGYFRQEGLFDQDTVCVVDSGWTGSIQRSMRQLLEFAGYTGRLTGFYFGMFENPKAPVDGEYMTWYFNAEGKILDKTLFNNNLFECLLSAPHGMTKGYLCVGDRYEPDLLPQPSEREMTVILSQSEGILRFIGEKVGTIDFNAFDRRTMHKDTQRRVKRYMSFPGQEEAAYYGKLHFCDDVTEEYRMQLADRRQKDELKKYLILRRIARKILKIKVVSPELFWSCGTAAFLTPGSRWWYRINILAGEWIRYTLNQKKIRRREQPGLDYYKQMADPYETISFDIFDTLLFRTVSCPKDVFRLMEQNAEESYGIQDFYMKRIQAEQRARSLTQDEDIRFPDIYAAMQVEGNVADDLMWREKDAERYVLRRDPVMAELLDWCVRQGKRVLIISDMYHSKAFLAEVLRNVEISGYSALYVSSEEKATKASGSLYRRILERERISKGNWLHIGDNIRSDYLMPERLGIHAAVYDNGR